MMRNVMNGDLFGCCTAAFRGALALVGMLVIAAAAVQSGASAALEIENDFDLKRDVAKTWKC